MSWPDPVPLKDCVRGSMVTTCCPVAVSTIDVKKEVFPVTSTLTDAPPEILRLASFVMLLNVPKFSWPDPLIVIVCTLANVLLNGAVEEPSVETPVAPLPEVVMFKLVISALVSTKLPPVKTAPLTVKFNVVLAVPTRLFVIVTFEPLAAFDTDKFCKVFVVKTVPTPFASADNPFRVTEFNVPTAVELEPFASDMVTTPSYVPPVAA